MPILPDRKPLAETDAARSVARLLAGTPPIARRDLNTAMTEAMAASDADLPDQLGASLEPIGYAQ